jgi:alpha-1,2-mannosyltransferase
MPAARRAGDGVSADEATDTPRAVVPGKVVIGEVMTGEVMTGDRMGGEETGGEETGGEETAGEGAAGEGAAAEGAAGSGQPTRARRPGAVVPPARSAAGVAIVIATALALGLRLFLLSRPGFLTSGNVEYDDGVYLGAAMRLLHGALPYRDYAFVQPPGIIFVGLPAAGVGALTTQAAGLAAARVLSVLASTACVPLAGRLVRHRGPLTTAVTAGLLAVYPADVLAARTLLLEPWMNLACLLAVTAAFQNGRLASPRRLAWAGVALGCGVSIKFWAVIPAAVLLAVCLAARPAPEASRIRRGGAVLGGAVAAFAVIAGPFAVFAPSGFVHQTLLDQVSRVGSYTPISLRLAHLTGLIDILGRNGRLVSSGSASHSLFALGAEASTHLVAVGWPAFAAAALAVAVIAAGYLHAPRDRAPLDWFALVTAVGASAAIMGYSAFFYHYPDFPGPWIAITAGIAVGSLACLIQGISPPAKAERRAVAAAIAVVILVVAGIEARELASARVPASPAAATALIPQGSCLVADQVSFAIAAGRFAAPTAECPDVVDALATTLVLSGGVSPQGGAGQQTQVIAGWENIFGRARYVWLSGGFEARIPWNPMLQSWFSGHFRLLATFSGYGDSKLYVRSR